MWNVGRTVKEIVHAVASECLHNGAPIGSGDRFTCDSSGQENRQPSTKQDIYPHYFPDISDQGSGFTDAYGSIQSLSGDTHQLFRVFINDTHGVGFVQVRMQTLWRNVKRVWIGGGRLQVLLPSL